LDGKKAIYFLLALLCISFIGVGLSEKSLVINDRNVLKTSSTGEELLITFDGAFTDEDDDLLATDSNGNIYVAHIVKGMNNVSLLKFNSNGVLQWNVSWKIATAYGIYIDSSDKIYITGSISGDIYILTYNISGDLIMNTTWGSSENDNAYDITADETGNIYVCGYIYGLKNQTALVKFDNNGNYLWNITDGIVDDSSYGEDVCLDSSGNIYVVGIIEYGGSNWMIEILYCNKSGSLIWSTEVGIDNYRDVPFGLSMDSQGNLYISGITTWPSISPQDYQFLLIKVSPEGLPLWTRVWGGSEWEFNLYVAVNSLDEIFVAGLTKNFEPGYLDIYLAKFNSNSERLWSIRWDSGENDLLNQLYIDKTNDDLYLLGKSTAFSRDKIEKLMIIKNPTFPTDGSNGDNPSTPSGGTIPGFSLFLGISLLSVCLIVFSKKAQMKFK